MSGIDYGNGLTNIDNGTGIRYGVIAQASVMQAWADSAEADYGEPHCPKCGNEAGLSRGYNTEEWEGSGEFCCLPCHYVFDGDEAFGEEPIGWNYDDDGYKLVDCLDVNIMVLASPFYTFAPFCSPCVPGAGDLDNAGEGVKTYCLGHDWFEDGKAPYPVYSVATGELVTA
jgi:ribosomal protein L37AE/L43A